MVAAVSLLVWTVAFFCHTIERRGEKQSQSAVAGLPEASSVHYQKERQGRIEEKIQKGERESNCWR